jgi:hypothetical protein
MKKNVLVFGLISGLIVTAMMVISTITCYNSNKFEGSEVLGYTTMLIAFSFIFVAIKNYRDKYNNGVISFGKAFKIGLFVTLIAGTMYLLAWLVEYYLFVPDFMDKYCTHVINNARADGASSTELAEKTKQMDSMRELYKNPLFVILFTYFEIVPVGLLVTIICALILKRKPKQPAVAVAH